MVGNVKENYDWEINQDVSIIIDRLVNKVKAFSFFEREHVFYVTVRGKKYKKPIRVISCKYPYYLTTTPYVYIFEVMGDVWSALSQKQKNLSVYHAMCGIPLGGFDPAGKDFARKLSVDYELYADEFDVAGVPDWLENPDAIDPLDSPVGDGKKRVPVTKETIAAV